MANSTSTFWGPDFDQLSATDPKIAGVVLGELDRPVALREAAQ